MGVSWLKQLRKKAVKDAFFLAKRRFMVVFALLKA
jgi:hypothetical protein